MISVILFLAIGFLCGIAITAAIGKNQFVKDLLSESGAASFGRFGALIALLASVVWVSWCVYKTSAIPDLSGVCFFIGTLYGLSKGISAFQTLKSNAAAQEPGK